MKCTARCLQRVDSAEMKMIYLYIRCMNSCVSAEPHALKQRAVNCISNECELRTHAFLMILLLFSFSPNFVCQIFLASAMKVGNAFFEKGQKRRIVENIHGFFKAHAVHLANLVDDSCVLCLQYCMVGFIVHRIHRR